jgi:hypothetical protein
MGTPCARHPAARGSAVPCRMRMKVASSCARTHGAMLLIRAGATGPPPRTRGRGPLTDRPAPLFAPLQHHHRQVADGEGRCTRRSNVNANISASETCLRRWADLAAFPTRSVSWGSPVRRFRLLTRGAWLSCRRTGAIRCAPGRCSSPLQCRHLAESRCHRIYGNACSARQPTGQHVHEHTGGPCEPCRAGSPRAAVLASRHRTAPPGGAFPVSPEEHADTPKRARRGIRCAGFLD